MRDARRGTVVGCGVGLGGDLRVGGAAMRSTEEPVYRVHVLRAVIRWLKTAGMWASIALVLFYLLLWMLIAPLGY